MAFKKGSLEVKSHAWDSNLGGRDFDQVLYEHFADEFKAKTKLDVRTNAKSTFRLLASVEKVSWSVAHLLTGIVAYGVRGGWCWEGW